MFIFLRVTLLLEQFKRICTDHTQNRKHFCSIILSRRYGCSWRKFWNQNINIIKLALS